MPKLVSILIPCFNAELWIASAIESCLAQTYSPLEVIVVDDGSTDRSVEIIRQYGDRIRFQQTPHHGGNHARNLAFSLCKGEYIQYLDADDCLFPEKIARQVQCLEETHADVIYGDWRRLYHIKQDYLSWGQVQISGEPVHILEKLLANSWWVAVSSLLYRREWVEKVGGWDEQLFAAQDRDFFLRVVLQGARVVYQPGCYSVYRYYGDVTVSTSSRLRWLESHLVVTGKAEAFLTQSQQLCPKKREAIVQSYFSIAREMLHYNFQCYLELIQKITSLSPEFDFNSRRRCYKVMQHWLGFERAEQCAGFAFLIQGKLNAVKSTWTQWWQHSRSIFSNSPLPYFQTKVPPEPQDSQTRRISGKLKSQLLE